MERVKGVEARFLGALGMTGVALLYSEWCVVRVGRG